MSVPAPVREPGSRGDESAVFVRQIREIVGDLEAPKGGVYWADFLCTVAVAYSALAAYLMAANWTAQQAAGFVVAGLALYRAAVFTHEIAHRTSGTFRGFEIAWNALCGIPALMPSFLYGDHKSHHSNRTYGTDDDAEYLVGAGPARAGLFLLLAIVYPLLGWLRFLLLTPVILVVRALDRPVWRTVSSLYMMNPKYRREYDQTSGSIGRWAQETAACAWAWCIAGALASGAVTMEAAAKIYLVFLFWMGLNQLRTLAAHGYGRDGQKRNHVEQVLDTNTFERGLLPELWAPLGMRYHALHHLMPTLPYHALGRAHKRLMERLPLRSPYRHTLQPDLWHALRQAFER